VVNELEWLSHGASAGAGAPEATIIGRGEGRRKAATTNGAARCPSGHGEAAHPASLRSRMLGGRLDPRGRQGGSGMANSQARQSLPPGTGGLPLVGETLAFASNPFAFVSQRRARFGDVFRTHILGKPPSSWPPEAHRGLARSGQGAARGRDARQPARPLRRPRRHRAAARRRGARARKRSLLAAFAPEAIASTCRAAGAHRRAARDLARPRPGAGHRRPEDARDRIARRRHPRLERGSDELARLLADNAILAKAFTALPIGLPGTAYTQGLQARDRILALLTRVAERHLAAPEKHADGLSRILAAAQAAGAPLDAATAAREMHHFLLAGMIVYAELAAMLRSLHDHPRSRRACAPRCMANAAGGPIGRRSCGRCPT
jgi:brassinosteroid-6-oxidase 2